ncbi:MAG: hypothetical protein CM15mP70_15730 [Pelagibacteraceae bacterium]|nr:MAG: hypothetical protein CM15mP70_15730 [Pelagibacteraceae bacterium]
MIKIDMPKIKNELILIISAVFVLSLGDLTSVTIFNDSSFRTIPLFVSQLIIIINMTMLFYLIDIYNFPFLYMYFPSRFLNRNA